MLALCDTVIVPEHCTCGAQLPPDARFCHKCGKPQTAEALQEEEQSAQVVEPTPPPIEVRPEPVEISFRNPLAVRIALFLAMLTFLLAMLLGPFILLWMITAGAVAVYLYRRRTGQSLTARGGARLGWITGVFMFIISMILIATIALALTDKSTVDVFMTQMKQRGSEATAQQLITALQSPGQLFQVLLESFIFCGVLPMIGGLLGAKLTGGPGPRPAG
jgi:uncharacterized protein YqgC (DUF456 family)